MCCSLQRLQGNGIVKTHRWRYTDRTFCLRLPLRGKPPGQIDIDLNTLTGITHLLIRLWDILWILRLDRHPAAPAKHAVQPGHGARISSLPKLHPKHDKPGVRIAAAHIPDQLQLLLGVLIRMMMRSARFLTQRFKRAVVPPQPTVNVLSVRFVLDRRLCYSVFLRIFQKGLTKLHILCYTVHSNWEPPLLLFGVVA